MSHDRRNDPEFTYPVVFQKCSKHRLATRIWRGIKNPDQYTETCQCCDRKVGQEVVQTKCRPNSSQFSFLGPGIPLFFKFLKYSTGLLVLFTLIFSIFGLYTNISSRNCERNQECVPTVFNSLSIVNKKMEFYLLRIQNYILLVFVICCFLLLHVFRYRFRKTETTIDKLNVSASDYSIIIKRLPHNVNEQSIKIMIENQIQEQNFKAKQLEAKTKISQPQVKLDMEKVKIIFSHDITDFLKDKQNQLDQFKKSIDNKEHFSFKDYSKPKQSIGEIAIVVFPDSKTKDYFISEPNFCEKVTNYFFPAFPPLSNIRIQDKLVAIQRAPQPEDILWENAHITPCQRTIRKILLNFVSFILLMIGGACQYGLALWQTQIQDPKTKILIGTVASICVTVSNNILTTFLVYSTVWQRMGTRSQYLEVLTFKLIFQQFLNSGVFVVGANVLANFSDSMLENNLADTITQIMIMNAIMPNLSVLILNYTEVVGRVKRFIFLESGFFIKTQLEANLLYELPKPDFTQKYSYIVKTLWLTAFYAPFVPIVVPISAIGLTIKYFIEKFLFSRSYSIAEKISSYLNESCMEGLEYIPLIFSIGEFLIFIYLQTFFDEAPQDWLIPIYVCLGLSFLNIILPMEGFNQQMEECIKGKPGKKQITSMKLRTDNQISYSDAIKVFQITYEMTYPASNITKKKRKDTLFKSVKIVQKQIKQLQKIGILGPQKISPLDNFVEEGSFFDEQSNSNLNLRPEQTSVKLGQPDQNIPIIAQETSFVMFQKKSESKQEAVKFSAISSTRPNESEFVSICEAPPKTMDGDPEPGKLLKEKENNGEVIQSQEDARKLFQFYEKKKATNKLIQIREQDHDDDQKVAVQ